MNKKITYAPLFVFLSILVPYNAVFATPYQQPPLPVPVSYTQMPLGAMEMGNNNETPLYATDPYDISKIFSPNTSQLSTGYWPVSECPYQPKQDPSEIPNGCKLKEVKDGRCVIGYQAVDANGKQCQRDTSQDITSPPKYAFDPFAPVWPCPVVQKGRCYAQEVNGCPFEISCSAGSISSSGISPFNPANGLQQPPAPGGALGGAVDNFISIFKPFFTPPPAVNSLPKSSGDRSIFSPPVENTIINNNGVWYQTLSDGDLSPPDPSDPRYPSEPSNGSLGHDISSDYESKLKACSGSSACESGVKKEWNDRVFGSATQHQGIMDHASRGNPIMERVEKTRDESGKIIQETHIPLNKLYDLMFSAFDTFATFLEKIKGMPIGNFDNVSL